MQAVIVIGIPGAGKSTIIDRITDADKYSFVNIGDMMISIGTKKGRLNNRDQMRYQSNEERTELIKEVFKEIATMKGNVIIDTHASIGAHGRYMPGLPADVLSIIKDSVKALVCIDAPTENIIIRRERDTTRRREAETVEEIEMQKMINMAALSAISQSYNIPLFVLINEENRQDESVRKFKECIKSIFNDSAEKAHK
jgi:adenylate kinase